MLLSIIVFSVFIKKKKKKKKTLMLREKRDKWVISHLCSQFSPKYVETRKWWLRVSFLSQPNNSFTQNSFYFPSPFFISLKSPQPKSVELGTTLFFFSFLLKKQNIMAFYLITCKSKPKQPWRSKPIKGKKVLLYWLKHELKCCFV